MTCHSGDCLRRWPAEYNLAANIQSLNDVANLDTLQSCTTNLCIQFKLTICTTYVRSHRQTRRKSWSGVSELRPYLVLGRMWWLLWPEITGIHYTKERVRGVYIVPSMILRTMWTLCPGWCWPQCVHDKHSLLCMCLPHSMLCEPSHVPRSRDHRPSICQACVKLCFTIVKQQ